jgi:hypothetical protein
VEYRPSTNKSNVICTYKYIERIYLKAGLVKETKRGEKEGKKDIGVGTRNQETH